MKCETVLWPTNLDHGHSVVQVGALDKMLSNGRLTSQIGVTHLVAITISLTMAFSTGKNTCLQMELAMAKETFTLKFGLCITTQQPAYDQTWTGIGAGTGAESVPKSGV